ncbi:MAG TPA: acyl carrier protein [Chitinophagales bacterium]|nr:acyl carrier protein [Chitinophagales bacterium]
MELAAFIQSLEQEFDNLPSGTITGETEFRKVEGWSSMMALIIIAKIDSDYGVTISAEELAKCNTINDLFELVHAKAA